MAGNRAETEAGVKAEGGHEFGIGFQVEAAGAEVARANLQLKTEFEMLR